jgi:hypothetical protein
MTELKERNARESGKMRPGILMWALGIPIPVIILILLFSRGC